jgi:anthranilate/para-aminobenzoate synthase component I
VRLVSEGEHVRRIGRLLRDLRDGEIYQANLAQRFEVAWRGSALPLHAVLRSSNPSPMSGWLRGPGWELVSNSPERLVRLRGRELVSEPCGGPAPRPAGPATPEREVTAIRDRLVASTKDHAEHVMIVDIHRNDVGRASAPGTLRVESMMRIDRRSHVLQAVADVRGTLRQGADAVSVIEAMFPGGCVTGVPKIRCMEILDEVERAGRGPYTGSFGYLAAWGDLDLNVIIRSAWRTGERLAFAAGGGIVLDSDPSAEWAECEAKAAALLAAVESLRSRRDTMAG